MIMLMADNAACCVTQTRNKLLSFATMVKVEHAARVYLRMRIIGSTSIAHAHLPFGQRSLTHLTLWFSDACRRRTSHFL